VHGRSETACPSSLKWKTAEFKLVEAFACEAFASLCLGGRLRAVVLFGPPLTQSWRE
jgi:hypothetical protein